MRIVIPGRITVVVLSLLCLVVSVPLLPQSGTVDLGDKEFARANLAISTATAPLGEIIDRLPNAVAWRKFVSDYGPDILVYIDPRSGSPAGVIAGIPLIPGSGKGNEVTLESIGSALAKPVAEMTQDVVAEAVRKFILAHQDIMAIATTQVGTVQAVRVTDYLWQINAPQVVDGVPVRFGRLGATINHGNLVLFGTELWGNVQISTSPTLSPGDALRIGFEYAGGRLADDVMWKEPALEIVPYVPADRVIAYQLDGPIGGDGYGHSLVWVFGFERSSESGYWEVMVDAQTAELIAFRDVTLEAKRKVKGGVYPLTSTDACQSADRCGTMMGDYPMPWADYRYVATPPPYYEYTNGAGVFEYDGTATTTLAGRYAKIYRSCGLALSVSADFGDIDLAGTTGEHDCPPGLGANSPAAKTAFYEVSRITEIARGWLPGNPWLQGVGSSCLRTPPEVTVNKIAQAYCGGGYQPPNSGPSQLKFQLPALCRDSAHHDVPNSQCRNLGENANIIAHEWAHALDDNDKACSGGNASNPGEAYADIAAMYRHQVSCFGYGILTASPSQADCERPFVCTPLTLTSDGTGYNARENFSGAMHCDVDCSGFRDANFAKHNHDPQIPDTPQNFVCTSCSSGMSGPCGGEAHCAAAPVTQAAWDLATRDLTVAPFYYDTVTAFNVASKLYYQGSSNIGAWYQCDCAAGTSGGCGAVSGYLQWLAADDDNGYYYDGTPHMTAIASAFGRHNIACSGITAQNSGCAGGPGTAPIVSLTKMPFQVDLSWTNVVGASGYWVFRTEGHAACNMGRALIARVTGTSFIDTNVASGRAYYYSVMAAGATEACFGPSSSCKRPDAGAAADVATSPGTLLAGTYSDTHTANDVREALVETLEGSVSRLTHTWRFDDVPSGSLNLVFEGYRPLNPDSDNFQFSYSTDGQTFTPIPDAVIKKSFEPTGGQVVFLGQPTHSGILYVRLEDTNQTSGTSLDEVRIDFLGIGAV